MPHSAFLVKIQIMISSYVFLFNSTEGLSGFIRNFIPNIFLLICWYPMLVSGLAHRGLTVGVFSSDCL